MNRSGLFRLVMICTVAMSVVGRLQAQASEVQIVIGGLMAEEGGDWDPSTSPLKRPFGIDFDPAGRMFIVELEGGRVHRFDPDGTLTQVGGDGSNSYRGDGGPLAAATFDGMHNCAVTPEGDLYIADSWNHCVRKVDGTTGIISTVAGTGTAGYSGDGGPARQAEFDFIMCITLNHRSDVLHVADLKNRRIRAINLNTGIVSTIAGNGARGVPEDGAVAIESPLVDPRAAAADSQDNVYVLERGGHALRVIRPDGTISTVAGDGRQGFRDGPGQQAQFGSPKHICVDDADNVYVADDANKAIRRYDPRSGNVSTVLGQGHGDPRIRLLQPHGVCWQKGWLYVLDTSHNRILRLTL